MIERLRVRIPAGAAGEFSSPGSTFCADSYFGIRSTPRVTAVARKRSWSFCQKCRWQVTAKHAYTLRMWLCMKWHGAWLYDVHRTCAETAAVSCGISHASAVSTPLRWIFKKCAIKLVTHVEPHASAVSLLKKAENSAISYISDHQSKTENAGLIDHMKKWNPCSAHTATICFKSRPNSFENMEHRWAKTEYI